MFQVTISQFMMEIKTSNYNYDEEGQHIIDFLNKRRETATDPNAKDEEKVPMIDETLCDALGLYTPDIYFNDSATVFLVVGQK